MRRLFRLAHQEAARERWHEYDRGASAVEEETLDCKPTEVHVKVTSDLDARPTTVVAWRVEA